MCALTSGDLIFVGDDHGFGYCFDKKMNKIWEHQLYLSAIRTFTASEKTNNDSKQYLVCVGDELSKVSVESKDMASGLLPTIKVRKLVLFRPTRLVRNLLSVIYFSGYRQS